MSGFLLASWIKIYNIDSHKMWRQPVDHKYDTESPNIFCSCTVAASQFFKGVRFGQLLQPKWGFRWKTGNGKKVKSCEDNWLGSSSLAT